ncbi:NB-ARC domain-containing protein [Streptomyces sp. NPDC060223]|uniref:NB-ARC domain-containing protein n=1 Tax=Streptomyces sp. NPDC060223 TaxID=3347077 RepID=UPI00364767DA
MSASPNPSPARDEPEKSESESGGRATAQSGRPGNLLPETRGFVGRAEELAWLDEELNPGIGVGRLVSLVGAGGVGKTRLATRAAARVRDAYPDGVWLVELSALHTAGLVGLAVVEALRLADQSTGPVTEVVAEWAMGKRLLLILDSCEHVLADCVALAETLLPTLPGLRILVTSREQLRLPGERVLQVDPLPVADDAVALFAERAAATGFTLDDTNRPAVEAVCRHLDGIPLAIELAAVRLSELSLAELHGRLGEHLASRLDVLVPRGDEPRHGDVPGGGARGSDVQGGGGRDRGGPSHGGRDREGPSQDGREGGGPSGGGWDGGGASRGGWDGGGASRGGRDRGGPSHGGREGGGSSGGGWDGGGASRGGRDGGGASRGGRDREGSPRDGWDPDAQDREAPPRERPRSEGPRSAAPRREQPRSQGSPSEGPPRESPRSQGSPSEGPPREGPRSEGPRSEGLPSEPPPREGPPRHHTLRTAIGWSHELCEPLERLLWARLSVFTDGFCVGAAEEVCSGGPLPARRIAGLLGRLVEQSIVRRHRTDPARFQFLDTVREFGADWLRALGEERAVRLRHRDYYRGLAREGCAEWNTGRQVAWCERVLIEHANLRAAVDCALTEPDSRVALEMAADVGFLWRHCGYLRDAQHCLDVALATDPAPGPDRTRALWVRGAVAMFQGDLKVAANWAVRCADAAQEQGDPVAMVAAAYLTGGQIALSGRLSEAVDVLASTPRLPIGADAFGAAQLQVRVALSFTHLLGGDYERARTVADEAREASAECGESWAGAFADGIVAHADLATGNVHAAVRNARTALAGHVLMHNTVGAAVALDVLAAAVVAAGDGPRAARLLGIAARVWDLTGRAQMDSPDLIATRRSHELRVRDEIGETAYKKAYEEGRTMRYEEGLDYAVHGR